MAVGAQRDQPTAKGDMYVNIRIYLVPGQEIRHQLAWAIRCGAKVDIYCADDNPDEVRTACASLIRRLLGGNS